MRDRNAGIGVRSESDVLPGSGEPVDAAYYDSLLKSINDLLREAFERNGEDFSKMVTTLGHEQLKRRFDMGFGGDYQGPMDSLAWGPKYVYTAYEYDGSTNVISALRNPPDNLN